MIYVNRNGMAIRLSDQKQVAYFEWEQFRDVEPMTDREKLNFLLAKIDDVKAQVMYVFGEMAARPAELGPLTRVRMDAIESGAKKLDAFDGSVVNIADNGDGTRTVTVMDQAIVDRRLREAREAKD